MVVLLSLIVAVIITVVIRNWIPITIFVLAAMVFGHFQHPHGEVSVYADQAGYDANDNTQIGASIFNDSDNLVVTHVAVNCGNASGSWTVHVAPGQSLDLHANVPGDEMIPDNVGHCGDPVYRTTSA